MLYKHIIQVENENVGLKVCVCGGGGAQTYHCPQLKKWGAHAPLAPPPPTLPTPVIRYVYAIYVKQIKVIK